ncbi:helix-turn-helix domain-containing protein [Enterobacter mori]|uniref:helix-turn-helix domain-containing protein n=1 Tax=Enterobacter mori TaxID=539813 RepID=UPI002FD7369E
MKTSSNHIATLLEWIEKNLSGKLNADVISDKSGYTKWHLQKMFKAHTGLTLTQYIKGRRLCKAAFELCFTNRKVADIADDFQFDSPQSFSRSFSLLYGVSPKQFRANNEISFNNFTPKFIADEKYSYVKGEFYSVDHLIVNGKTDSYCCSIKEMKKPHRNFRIPMRERFINDNQLIHSSIYTLSKFSSLSNDTLLAEYHIGTVGSVNSINNERLPVIFGDFLRFDMVGSEYEVDDFVLYIYMHIFSFNKLTRRVGYDVEVFTWGTNKTIIYSYYIPVVFDKHLIKYISEN